MAHDLLFGKTRRNWARGSCASQATDEVDFKLTQAEMAMLADLAITKTLADSGDKKARRKMSDVTKKIAGLKVKAARGDAPAKRALRVLEESGVFRGVQSFSLGGDVTARVPNIAYRAAVLKQAHKLGSGSPTTRDFFLAKKKVDGVMQSAGLSLYLPGSRPGRITY